jgi:protein-tyrosine-phosphatase
MSTTDPRTATPPDSRLLDRTAARLRSEFEGTLDEATIRRVMDESWTSLADATLPDFVPTFVERFARERLRAIARVRGTTPATKPMVVFLCVHNAGRSQMAAGWMEHLAGDRVDVFSGGSEPVGEVNPSAVAAMAEVGIDISNAYPKPWTDEIVRAANVIVTMGCGDSCPFFPGTRYLDWEVGDPAGLPLEEVRPIRDEIGRRVRELVGDLGIRGPD